MWTVFSKVGAVGFAIGVAPPVDCAWTEELPIQTAVRMQAMTTESAV
jgi:hypothetical protein